VNKTNEHPFSGLFSRNNLGKPAPERLNQTGKEITGWQTGSGISWATCTSLALCSRQITIPAPQHFIFYRPDALPDAQPTMSKH